MISIELIRNLPYFSLQTNEQLKRIADISEIKPIEVGVELFAEGAPATHFCIIRTGEVNIVYTLGDNRSVEADTLMRGDAFGWSAIAAPHVMTASCIGNKKGEFIAIEGKGLRHLCSIDTACGHQIALELIKLLRDRLSALRVQIAAQL